jgi:hypothetical protein
VARIFAGIGLLIVVSACAPTARSIQPSSGNYQGWSCQQLMEEQRRLQVALADAYSRQSKARSDEFATVDVFGMPPASWPDQDLAPEIARYKSQEQAVREAASRNNCPANAVRTARPASGRA